MSGASLAIELTELSIIVATDRGYSPDPKRWNDKQRYVITDCVTSGVAQVYSPPAIEGEQIAPDWTFLKPITEISLVTGANQIKMPDDFGSCDGPVAVKTSATTGTPWWIEWTNEWALMGMNQATPFMTGPPRYIAEVALRDINPPSGQRRALMVFPVADQDYLLQVKYSINPNRLSSAQPYAYGGPQYRELFIASCLAVAEQRFDGVEGPAAKRFNTMLRAAVSQDNKNRPQKIGYNGNREAPSWRGYRHPHPLICYYNDVPITG